jgi:1-acyl-sn-glycerol-3-phosphate acyltransferase
MTTRSKKATTARPKRAARAPAAPVSKEIAAKARAKKEPAPKVTPKPAASANAEPSASPVAGRKRRPKKSRRAAALAAEPAVVAQIRELEAQLDKLIDEASRHDVSSLDLDAEEAETWHGEPRPEPADPGPTLDPVPGPTLDPVPEPTFDPVPEPTFDPVPEPTFDAEDTVHAGPPSASWADAQPGTVSIGTAAVPPAPESVFDTARELLSSDFYLRKWGRLAMRGRSEEVDDFGFDPIYDAKLKPALDFLYDKYFRVETSGIASVPRSGRCLLVANHSGTLPLDGVMIKAAVKREGRDVRWLTEDFIYHMPYLGSAMNRLGAVRACQENAERLLAKEQLVAVFPEGVKGIGKLFADRYRLQRFGRGGFIKLCLRTGTPIVPVAVTGAEETNPLLFKIEHLSKALGVPYVPVTPTFPLLGPLGLLPAPTKWTIQFGEPLDLSSHGPESADDEILVGKLAERVRATIQGMLDRTIGARKSVFFG